MLVSVLIPCFNAERWIAQAIDSALSQTWRPLEVIVVDDGSTDGSLEIIQSFATRIRYETGPNRGGNAARNRLLQMAGGQWLQYLDADDYILPDKVERQMTFASQQPGADVIYSPSLIEHVEGNTTRRRILEIPPPSDPWVRLARWYLPQTGAALWRQDAIRSVGGWSEDQPCCQEHELYLRLLIAGKVLAFCDYAGSVYRQWSEATVCKRDKPETHRRRLMIEDAAEAHLAKIGELSRDRLAAINQARFELARLIWQYDRALATSIMDGVRTIQPDFAPEGAAAPLPYRLIHQYLGFRTAERLADLRRRDGRSQPRTSAATSASRVADA